MKSISDKQNVILKRLSYLLHVKLLYLSRFVQIDFRIILGHNLELRTYPQDKYHDKCEVRDYPGMILNEKNDFTFWIRYGISTNSGMIVLDYPKSEVTQY